MVKKNILLETYGCTMNKGEGRIAGDILSCFGNRIVLDKNEEHDTVMIFTCAVIGSTENRMWKRIDEISKEKKGLIVGGCLASLRRKEILERYPNAVVLDTMGLADLGRSLGEDIVNGLKMSIPPRSIEDRIDNIVPVSTGCGGSCTYCITNYARGGLTSYPPSTILNLISRGLIVGRSEVLLTSQDSASYSWIDGNGHRMNLGTLISRITSSIPEDYRLRVGMMNPNTGMKIADDLIGSYRDEKVFRFLHVPVQSGSDEVLRAMNREYSISEYFEYIDRFRRNYPDLTLSTDIIVGFPNESAGQFDMSVEAVKKLRPDILNITRFSSRAGTAASRMKGHLPGRVIKDRSREMTAVHEVISQDILYSRLGSRKRCLVTEVGREGTMMARDENYTPVVIYGDRTLLGTYVDLEATDVGPSYLRAGREWWPGST